MLHYIMFVKDILSYFVSVKIRLFYCNCVSVALFNADTSTSDFFMNFIYQSA